MPRPNRDVSKAKDFKGAIKRLLQELSDFKKLIIISLVLAALGAMLTIVTPNILSDLTDEISKGLVLNKDNFLKLTKEVTSSLNEENNRIGISVSKKVGNSVIRHHITRLVRESYRLHEDMFDSGLDIVVIARVAARHVGYKEIESAVLHLGGLHRIIKKQNI